MAQKIHRKRRYYRRGRSPFAPILGWVLAAAILIPGSFFAAKFLSSRSENLPVNTPVTKPSATVSQTETTTTTTAEISLTDDTVYRGFYLPYTKLSGDDLDKTLKDAAAAGYNCAVIELKNKNGNTYYVSETELGKTAGAALEDSISLKSLTDAFAKMRTVGITPVPLLYCFEDAIAPRTVPDAKVTTIGHDDWTWYDGDPKNGGKPWLNPYADAAGAYLISLAEELKTAGAGALMLDGVYFPTQTSQANFAVGKDAALEKGQVLYQFISRMKNTCDMPILLRASANAALGNSTAGYHILPTELGVTAVVADLRVQSLGDRLAVGEEMVSVFPAGMGDLVSRVLSTMKQKMQVSSQAPAPKPAATLSGDIDVQIANLDKTACYFVYDAGGNYDFTPQVPAQ